MARPLRLEFPGACYHIIARGNFRFPVFRDGRDCERLLAGLVRYAEAFGVQVRAYCVMTNHFHAYVRTGEANLGRFMQSFLTSFCVGYNRRHRTSAHVFQGRYKAYVVEDESSYRWEVSRYIHLNPACIPSLRDSPVEVRQRTIREYRWSSYAATIGLQPCPAWLDRAAVLRGFPGARLNDRQRAYARYVEQGLTSQLWDPAAAAAAQTVIGSDTFVDRLRRATASVSERSAVRRECGQQVKLLRWCRLRDVVHAVAAAYGLAPKDLLLRWSRANRPRQVLLYLASERCRGRYTATELARRLGRLSVSGLAKAHQRVKAEMAENTELRLSIRQAEGRIDEKSKA